jgi:Transmembrane amino acid transporter protein
VNTLPWFQFFEGWVYGLVPNRGLGACIHWEKRFRIPLTNSVYHFSPFRLVWRTFYVVVTTLIAMLMPFFNDVLGLLGAIGFYPLTIYFPIAVHRIQNKVEHGTAYWWWLMFVDVTFFGVSVLAAFGSILGIVADLRGF